MALEDIVDWEQMYVLVNELGVRGYKMQHFDVCKRLWQTKVPESGQADTVQGELLREIEKLRSEAMDNGNINWDDNYAFFCDNLKNTFAQSGFFDEGYLDKLSKLLGFVKQCGEYAAAYGAGEIPEDEADPVRFAYVDDDLYDFISDAAAVFVMNNPTDIPYQKKDFIYR